MQTKGSGHQPTDRITTPPPAVSPAHKVPTPPPCGPAYRPDQKDLSAKVDEFLSWMTDLILKYEKRKASWEGSKAPEAPRMVQFHEGRIWLLRNVLEKAKEMKE